MASAVAMVTMEQKIVCKKRVTKKKRLGGNGKLHSRSTENQELMEESSEGSSEDQTVSSQMVYNRGKPDKGKLFIYSLDFCYLV